MRIWLNIFGFVALTASVSPALAAGGPSFSCARVTTDSVEDLICSDAALSRQDRDMAAAYNRVRARVRGTEGLGLLMESQQSWLRERAACADLRTQKGVCISETTRNRIAELNRPSANQSARTPIKTGTNTSSRPPQGPSFSCANARTLTERRICASRELSIQDRQIAALFNQLKRLVADSASLTAREVLGQREFIANRNRCDARPNVIQDCLEVSHENRIAVLEERIAEIQSRP